MEHPITPPPPPYDLVKLWLSQWVGADTTLASYIADQAAQWGADQELEACCKWLAWESPTTAEWVNRLRAARRPKPPSLKAQALEAATRFYAKGHEGCTDEEVKADFDAICRALKRLEELEAAND